MAQLVVRQLPVEVKERLKRRAKRHGRSLEAEVRDILENAITENGRALEKSQPYLGDRLKLLIGKSALTPQEWAEFDQSIVEMGRNRKMRKLDLGE